MRDTAGANVTRRTFLPLPSPPFVCFVPFVVNLFLFPRAPRVPVANLFPSAPLNPTAYS